jgi:exopolysaccharide biosynthesis polyprenyl glycosylphosphotransferase
MPEQLDTRRDVRAHSPGRKQDPQQHTGTTALSVKRAPGVLRSPADFAGSGRTARRDAVYRRLLVLADLWAAGLAIVCCVVLLGGAGLQHGLPLLLPLVLLLSKVIGLYDHDDVVISRSTLDELPSLFQLATVYTLVVWLTEAHSVQRRSAIVGLWLVLFLFTALARIVARYAARRLTSAERCLFVGAEQTGRWLKSKLASNPHLHAELVGSVPYGGGDPAAALHAIQPQTVALDVDRVILALHGESEADAGLELITAIKSFGCKVSLMPRMLEVVGSSVEFEDVDGVPVLGVRRFGLSRSSRAVKRGLDLAIACFGLLMVGPLMALMAVAIKLDSSGPVLFRQTRVGRDGKRFSIVKFRSMVDGADAQKAGLRHLNEAGGLFKIVDDPRITRMGSLLRRTSLDELPQLLNVVRGEMSLVGPRPLVLEDDCLIQGWHRRRLHLKPGMTGPWQILGSTRIPLEEMVTIDYLYVANWSLWADVKILLRTVAHVFARRGC